MGIRKKRVDVLDIKQDVKDGLIEFYVKNGKIYAAEVLHGMIGSVCVDGEHGDTVMVGTVSDPTFVEWPKASERIRFVGQSSHVDENGTLIVTDDYEQFEPDGTAKRWSTVRGVKDGVIHESGSEPRF